MVALADLRAATAMTLDEVCRRVTEEDPSLRPTRGSMSAIENGHRGVSAPMLAALTSAYGLPQGAITTDYKPRHRTPQRGAR